MRTNCALAALLGLAGFLFATPASAVTFTNLYTFSADAFGSGPNPPATNSDGVNPNGLVLSGNTIFGTAAAGGLYGDGTLFRVGTDGTHFTNLFNFNLGTFVPQTSTYPGSTGDNPNPGLLLVDNTLYGTTFYGGVFDAGTVFRINTGAEPESLVLFDGTLYGMTSYGFQGISLGDGGVYALVLQPALNLTLLGNQSIVTWNDPSYFLYAAPTITNMFAKVPGAASPYSNPVAGKQRFFQLRPN